MGGDGALNEANPYPSMSEAEHFRNKHRVAIGVSGWPADELEITSPWESFEAQASKLSPLAGRRLPC